MSGQERNKTYYLAGPMSGIPQFNFPAFDKAARELREYGWKIVSPAEMDDPETRAAALASKDGIHGERDPVNGYTWGDFLARDVKIIADEVQGIIFLPRWHTSRGARLEAFVGLLCKHEFREYIGVGNPVPRSELWVKKKIL